MASLSVRNLNAFYGKAHVLHDTTISVESDRVTGILGRNGAGKTSLLKSIMRLDIASTGEVSVLGQDIRHLATDAIARLGVAYMQKLNLRDPLALVFLLAVATILSAFVALLLHMPPAALAPLSSLLGNLTLFAIVLAFLVAGAWRKVPVYESFVEGAKQGFEVARDLLPYLVAMLCAVGVLRASGALDFALDGVRWCVQAFGLDTRFVDALPTALVKPLSGSAARALLIETMKTHGVDSFPALLAATVQGSTETTFYVLAVYFGAVGIRRARHAVGCALLADLAGVLASIAVCYWFFG